MIFEREENIKEDRYTLKISFGNEEYKHDLIIKRFMEKDRKISISTFAFYIESAISSAYNKGYHDGQKNYLSYQEGFKDGFQMAHTLENEK